MALLRVDSRNSPFPMEFEFLEINTLDRVWTEQCKFPPEYKVRQSKGVVIAWVVVRDAGWDSLSL